MELKRLFSEFQDSPVNYMSSSVSFIYSLDPKSRSDISEFTVVGIKESGVIENYVF